MKKIIWKIAITVAMFTFIGFLPIQAFAASNDEVLLDNTGNLTLNSQHAAKEGVSSFQLSLKVESEKANKVEFQFNENNAKVAQFRYHPDTQILNIYVAGTKALFAENTDSLPLGKITVVDENQNNVQATISIIEDSLKYVYGTRLIKAEDVNLSESVVINKVEQPVEAVTLDRNKTGVIVRKTTTLKAKVTPADAVNQQLTWASSDETIATVKDGEVTGVKAGVVTITVSSANGKSDSCEVTVVTGMGDVEEGSWQYDAVEFIYLKGIMIGKGVNADGSAIFEPNQYLTREEIAQMLYAAEEKPEVTNTNRFADVKEGQWYTNAILWAEANGIVSGYENGNYGVGDRVTREQLAVILYQYAKFKEYDMSKIESLDKFADAGKVQDWAKTQLEWAYANGIVSGKGEILDPSGNATRAECAAMIRTFIKNFSK